MKGTFSLLAFTYGIAAVHAAKCNDNCARAVVGTVKAMQASHMADCSSFLKTTVTPATFTSTIFTTVTPDTTSTTTTDMTATSYSTYTTVTTTVTTNQIPQAAAGRRAVGVPLVERNVFVRQMTVIPTAIPKYASACSGSPSKYSSACSCFGVTKSTVTAATPSTTTTTTISVTPTATIHTTSTNTVSVVSTATVYVCPPGLTNCGGNCVDFNNDQNNCGSCGHSCVASCQNGVCNRDYCANPETATSSSCGSTSCRSNNGCTCVATTDGNRCVDDNQTRYNACGLPFCSSSSDCPAGSVCHQSPCCGSNHCATQSTSCANAVDRRKLRRGPYGSSELSSRTDYKSDYIL